MATKPNLIDQMASIPGLFGGAAASIAATIGQAYEGGKQDVLGFDEQDNAALNKALNSMLKGSSSSGSGSSGGSAGSAGSSGPSKAQHQAAANSRSGAKLLKAQADSIKKGLAGFGTARDTRIGSIRQQQGIVDRDLLDQYDVSYSSLRDQTLRNERSEAADSFANLRNRARERVNAMEQTAIQGAGESDTLRAGLMSLRNWDANQQEINTAYWDTLSSVNASLGGLTSATKTSRLNNFLDAESKVGDQWQNYYNQMTDAYTNLGNIYGQMSSDYGDAMVNDKKSSDSKSQKSASKQAKSAFNKAAAQVGKAYSTQMPSAALQGWAGNPDFEGQQNMSRFEAGFSAQTASKAPEGAQLRSW